MANTRFGEMPWVALERRVHAIEQSLKLSNIEGWKEMKLNFEKLDDNVAKVKAKLDELDQKVKELESNAGVDDAENQAKVDEAADALEKALAADVVGSTGGVTESE